MARKSTFDERREYVARQRSNDPVVTEDDYNNSLHRYLAYHAANTDDKTSRKWILKFVSDINKQYATIIDKATDFELRSLSLIAHADARGQYLSPLHRTRLRVGIHRLIEKYEHKKVVAKQSKVPVDVEPKQDKNTLVAKTHRAEVDAAIDDYCQNDTPFSMKGYVATHNLNGAVAKQIGQSYVPLLKELREAVDGNDPQLKEAYSHFGKVKLKRFYAMVQQIIADCAQQVVTAKAPRKTRVVKEKPAGVLVAKLKYLKSFEELKLTSEAPVKLIGASEVWLYDTERRKLFVYKAEGTNKLSVKGTTLLNWDAKLSQVKTLRKPEVFMTGSLAKKSINDSFKAITTKAQAVNGRTNDKMIILKVF